MCMCITYTHMLWPIYVWVCIKHVKACVAYFCGEEGGEGVSNLDATCAYSFCVDQENGEGTRLD